MTGLVVLNYNSIDMVEKLVRDISSYAVLDHIVVVDNASTQDSHQRICALEGGKVHVLFSERNGGYSSGNNIGLRWLVQQGCDCIFLVNPDVKFEEQVVASVKQKLKENPEYGALSCQMKDSDGNLTPVLGMYRPTFTEQLLRELFSESRLNQPHLQWIKPGDKKIYPQAAIWGSFLAFSSEALNKIDFLDEGVFLYREEQILGYCMENAGFKLGITGEGFFWHLHEYKKESKQKRLQCVRTAQESDIYMWKKYRHVSDLQIGLLRLFQNMSLFLRALFYTLKGIT